MANRVDTRGLGQYLRRVEQNMERGAEKGLKELGTVLIERIRSRTRRGLDLNSRRFWRGYRPSTIKRKKQTLVDLTDLRAARDDGREPMLDSLYVDTQGIRTKKRIRLVLRGAKNQLLARITNAKWPWFGLGTKDRNLIRSQLQKSVTREVRKDRRYNYKIVIK